MSVSLLPSDIDKTSLDHVERGLYLNRNEVVESFLAFHFRGMEAPLAMAVPRLPTLKFTMTWIPPDEDTVGPAALNDDKRVWTDAMRWELMHPVDDDDDGEETPPSKRRKRNPEEDEGRPFIPYSVESELLQAINNLLLKYLVNEPDINACRDNPVFYKELIENDFKLETVPAKGFQFYRRVAGREEGNRRLFVANGLFIHSVEGAPHRILEVTLFDVHFRFALWFVRHYLVHRDRFIKWNADNSSRKRRIPLTPAMVRRHLQDIEKFCYGSSHAANNRLYFLRDAWQCHVEVGSLPVPITLYLLRVWQTEREFDHNTSYWLRLTFIEPRETDETARQTLDASATTTLKTTGILGLPIQWERLMVPYRRLYEQSLSPTFTGTAVSSSALAGRAMRDLMVTVACLDHAQMSNIYLQGSDLAIISAIHGTRLDGPRRCHGASRLQYDRADADAASPPTMLFEAPLEIQRVFGLSRDCSK